VRHIRSWLLKRQVHDRLTTWQLLGGWLRRPRPERLASNNKSTAEVARVMTVLDPLRARSEPRKLQGRVWTGGSLDEIVAE